LQCEPEIYAPVGLLSLFIGVVVFFMLAKPNRFDESVDEEPVRPVAWLFAIVMMFGTLNFEFGPRIMSSIVGSKIEQLEGKLSVQSTPELRSDLCVDGVCYVAVLFELIGRKRLNDGTLYDPQDLAKRTALGRVLVWPKTTLGGNTVKSFQICDADWLRE
jgi:hypothetical protein